MEPLAIVASCATLIATVGRCALAVTIFVREVRDARGDLDQISRELHSLDTVLACLKDDFAKPSSSTLPHKLVSHLGSILKSCEGVVAEIEKSLAKHISSRIGRGGHWTLGGGKDDMAKFRSSLEAHKSALDLALDMITMTVARDIKRDTAEIRHYAAAVPDIKNDTAQILEEIARLRARLPPDLHQDGPNIILQRFLDESTSYAETVVNEGIASEPSELPGSVPRTPAYESYQYPVSYTDFAFYPPERDSTSRETRVRGSFGPDVTPRVGRIPTGDRIPSPMSHMSKPHTTDQSDASSDVSRLSLNVDKDFEKARVSPTNSRLFTPPSRPLSSRQQYREVSDNATLGPTPLIEFQNHLRRPDDWKWLTLNHRTQSGNQSLSASELWTHRYTAMTRAPSYLAEINFTLRQQLHPPRETMLLIGIHYPDTFDGEEFNIRFATTLESITEALATTNEACGTSRDTPWWMTVVMCLIHSDIITQTQYAFTRHGMQLRCDAESEHCGIAPHDVRDDERKIYAHLWEHTTSRTKILWNRRGMPEYFEEGETPLQLIQCQYTSRGGRSNNMGSAEHLLPFIRMLDARSCVSVAAGDKISKFDVFDAYMTTRHQLSSIKIVDPMHRYPGTAFESSFKDRYGGVPTKIYPQDRATKFKQGKRSIFPRFGSMFN